MYKGIISNFTALAFVQITNYIIPLIMVPYLVRVIGIEYFGRISFAQACLSLFVIISDYGFNLNSTRAITLVKADSHALSKIVSTTIITKGLVTITAFLIYISICLTIPRFQNDLLFYVAGFSIVLGQAMLPIWFFQGIEQMKIITYLNLVSKTIGLGLLFLLVKERHDYLIVLPLFGIGNFCSGIIALYIMYNLKSIAFIFPSKKELLTQLREGSSIFISNFVVTLYTSSSLLILSFFSNELVLGYYGVAEKIMQAIRQLCGMFSQSIFPKACQLADKGHTYLKTMWRTIMPPSLFILLIITVSIFLISDIAVFVLTGGYSEDISTLIRILAFVPLLVFINIPAYQTLLAYNLQKLVLLVLVPASIFNLILNLILCFYFQAIGAAVALLITEAIISLGLYIVLEKRAGHYSLLR